MKVEKKKQYNRARQPDSSLMRHGKLLVTAVLD